MPYIKPIDSPASVSITQNAMKEPAKPSSRFAQMLQSAHGTGRELDPIFAHAASTYQVPQELLRAIAFHESGLQTDVVSSAGAMGLMQLMPVTAQAMGVADPFDAAQNVMGGAKLLGQYLEKYDGNLKLTLAAYGAGCGAVAKYNGIPPYPETQKFVEDIMSVVNDEIAAESQNAGAVNLAVSPQLTVSPENEALVRLAQAADQAGTPEYTILTATVAPNTNLPVPVDSASATLSADTVALIDPTLTGAEATALIEPELASISSSAAGIAAVSPDKRSTAASAFTKDYIASLQLPVASDATALLKQKLLQDSPTTTTSRALPEMRISAEMAAALKQNLSQEKSTAFTDDLYEQMEDFDGFSVQDYQVLVARMLEDIRLERADHSKNSSSRLFFLGR